MTLGHGLQRGRIDIGMRAIQRELENLILELRAGHPTAGSPEGQVLPHLLRIRLQLEDGTSPAGLAAAFNDLERFWLESIAWCSALSREVEKLLIDYADWSEGTAPDR